MFLLVPVHPGSPGRKTVVVTSKAVKESAKYFEIHCHSVSVSNSPSTMYVG